jgi:hypothetical protein
MRTHIRTQGEEVGPVHTIPHQSRSLASRPAANVSYWWQLSSGGRIRLSALSLKRSFTDIASGLK